MTWKNVLKFPQARWAIAFCMICIVIDVFYLPVFYGDIIQPKHGIYLNDAFLNLFTPVNWSVIIFSIIYLCILQTIFSVAKKPDLILLGLTTYFAVNLFRMATMYFLTLEPPTDMIFLADPISTKFYPPGHFAKDMFFSGHLSTMTLLVLIEKNRLAKKVKFVACAAIGMLLAWQHVHYTIDLLAAPVVTYGIFILIKNFLKPLRKDLEISVNKGA